MDQAKAIINLREGIIELEGPVEFVREYLDRIAAKKLQGARRKAQAPSKKEVVGDGQKAVRQPRRRRTGRISPADAVRTEVESGFFNEARSTPEIKHRLAEKGITFSTNSIRTGFKQLTDSAALNRIGRGRGLRFRHSG